MSIAVEVAVGTKLYVGSLPYSTTEQQLSELFSQYGTVQSAKVITDRYTGQSRGFGFVEMATGEEAQKAIAALNGSSLGGRTLVVNEARPQEKRPYGGGGAGAGERARW
jgi:RNA recognition motif-containing protein